MALSEYRNAAGEYREIASRIQDQSTSSRFPELITKLQVRARNRAAAALEQADDAAELRNFLVQWIDLSPDEVGPRGRLAHLEAKAGNYESAFRWLSEEHAIDPAQDQNWKATLLVELGTLVQSDRQILETVQRSIEKNPELRDVMGGMLREYFPAFEKLTAQARDSFEAATWLLFFCPILADYRWNHVAFAAAKSVELQLRATVFEPFAEDTKGKIRLVAAGDEKDALFAFVERGRPLTLGAMTRSLFKRKLQSDAEHALQNWLKEHRPRFSKVLTSGKLHPGLDVSKLRNDAAHGSISKAQAADLYRRSRVWLRESTLDGQAELQAGSL